MICKQCEQDTICAGGTRLEVQANLGAMYLALEAASGLDQSWDDFSFNRWKNKLRSAIIRMSAWVGSHGPVGPGRIPRVHQEYLEPTDEAGPRIDLENIYGVNLRT